MERAIDVGIDAAVGRAAMERAMALIHIPNAGGRYSSRCVDDPDTILAARTAVAEAIEMLTEALERE